MVDWVSKLTTATGRNKGELQQRVYRAAVGGSSGDLLPSIIFTHYPFNLPVCLTGPEDPSGVTGRSCPFAFYFSQQHWPGRAVRTLMDATFRSESGMLCQNKFLLPYSEGMEFKQSAVVRDIRSLRMCWHFVFSLGSVRVYFMTKSK